MCASKKKCKIITTAWKASQWVFGVVERDSGKKCFLVPVQHCDIKIALKSGFYQSLRSYLIVGRKWLDGMEFRNGFKFKVPVIILLPFCVCVALLYIVDIYEIDSYSLPMQIPSDVVEDERLLNGFLVKNKGCRIPEMDPFDTSVRKYIEKQTPPSCNKNKPPLVESNLTSLHILKSSFSVYNITDAEKLKCYYKEFHRTEPKDSESDRFIKYSNKKVYFDNEINLDEEFVAVFCKYEDKEIYKDYFSFIPLKQSDNEIMIRKKYDDLPLNILIIGLDALSRVNFHRQLPDIANYLTSIGGVEMLGYNKVADNTFVNLVPVLAGISVEELEKRCWKNNGHFDSCEFIWDMYKNLGFVTSFGEDAAWMGVFNYAKKGFKKQPTDYMWGPFNREAEDKIGNQKKLNLVRCVGSRETYKTLLDYIRRFVVTMNQARRKYFALYWTCVGHDELNTPSIANESLFNLFKDFYENGRINNTALIFMSDHGIRWGGIRNTYQGLLEERLPFLYVVLPDWFRRRFPEVMRNLKKNRRRLTTHFDLHDTLVHLSYIDQDVPASSIRLTQRGVSLFTEISPTRTCEDAGIAAHWCTCQQSVEVNKTDQEVVRVGEFVVEDINKQLVGYGQCAKLELMTISSARMMVHKDRDFKGKIGKGIVDYTLVIETTPGGGMFESTVRKNSGGKEYQKMGTISRLNLYGNQSRCIMDYHLKLYCYCENFF